MFTRSTFRRSRGIRLLAATTAAVTAEAPDLGNEDAGMPKCQEQVLDLTNDRVLDTSKVAGSAAQLSQTTGADVFVRAFQSTPGDSAAVWWRQAYPECPAWLATDGKTPKPNVLVVEFGLDHTSAVEYGSNFHRLDSDVDRLRAGMGTHLRRGDYTEAVTATLSTIQSLLTSRAGADPQPDAQGDDSAAFKHAVEVIFWVICAIAAACLLIEALLRLRAARRRRRQALERLAKARSDAAAAVLHSDLAAVRIQIEATRSEAEGGVSLDAIDQLADRQGELSGEFTQWAGEPIPKSTAEILGRARTFERIESGLNGTHSEANALALAADKRVADCAPEKKRQDLDEELQQLGEQEHSIAFLSVEPISQRAALNAMRDKLTALTRSMDSGVNPQRDEIDAALDVSVATRTEVAEQVERSREAHEELQRIAEKAQDVQERYSFTVAGVTSATASDTVAAAAAVAGDVQQLQSRLGAGELELDALVSEVAALSVRMGAATAEADKQRKKHRAARRAGSRYPSRTESVSSSGPDFSTGFIAGSVLGSSGHSSPPSSYDFGGGSSGGWDSGFSSGGDFGGGSSGGW
ncbi:Uncharacterised protein [Mycobacteroides abscessus subsp. abscessus]|nr:Uncharacterised protein [Mycobacteroides abscessus subsp. abscessus]